MFTGLVSSIGKVALVSCGARVVRLGIDSDYDAATVEIGASIAHNGCCLTVVVAEAENSGMRHFVDVAAESLALTTLGTWRTGDYVNLERSLRVGDELGGHFVQGHIDGLGELVEVETFRDAGQRMRFTAPVGLMQLIAKKGSIAVDGVSLTVNDVATRSFDVTIIPHTLVATTLGKLTPGDKVNLEADMMARYAARLIEARRNT
jgi:riboflavin synthase